MFATVNRPEQELFIALERATERWVIEINAQGLANTAWAFATVKRPDEKLFTSFARAAERWVNELNAQDLANMAWTLATVKRPDKELFVSLARAAERFWLQRNSEALELLVQHTVQKAEAADSRVLASVAHGAACKRVRCAEPRQHGMGVCNDAEAG